MYRCSNVQIQRFNLKIKAITSGWKKQTYLWEGAAPFQVTLLREHSCSKMMRSGTSSARRMLRVAPPFKIFFTGFNAVNWVNTLCQRFKWFVLLLFLSIWLMLLGFV